MLFFTGFLAACSHWLCSLEVVVTIAIRDWKLCRVYFHMEEIFKKPYSAYLDIRGRLLLLDLDFIESFFGQTAIKVPHVKAMVFRALTPRKLGHGALHDRLTKAVHSHFIFRSKLVWLRLLYTWTPHRAFLYYIRPQMAGLASLCQ